MNSSRNHTTITSQKSSSTLLYAFLILFASLVVWIIPSTPFEDRLAELPCSASSIENKIFDKDNLSREWYNPQGLAKGIHAVNPARIEYIYNVIQSNYKPLLKRSSLLTVLDIGCGSGIGTERLFTKDFSYGTPNMGLNITGIDNSIRSVDIAKAHYQTTEIFHHLMYTKKNRVVLPSLDYFVGSAYDLSMYEDESVDVIVSSHVMSHLVDVRLAMKEANRVLKKGGVFIFETINRTWSSYLWVQKFAEITGIIPYGTHDYRLFMTIDELNRLVEEESDNAMQIKDISGTKVSVGFGWEKFNLSQWVEGSSFSFNYPWPRMTSAQITKEDTSIGIIGYAVKN